METNWIIILDFSYGGLVKIKLTDEEKTKSEEFDDFESFLSTLEEKYEFRLQDCLWMTCESLSETTYINGKEGEEVWYSFHEFKIVS